MSGNDVGYTFNTSKNNESGNGTNNEENPMAEEYFVRQHYGNFGNNTSFISGPEQARRQKKIVEQRYKRNKFLMNNMLEKALENKDLFFDSEEYDRLVKENIGLRNQLGKKPKKEYFYPPSFGTRLYTRCFGGQCELVKVPYTPQLPSYYRERKQTKVNTRKSNTRKSNTRKRSNF